MQVGRLGSAVIGGDAHRHALGAVLVLGVLDEHVPVPIVLERVRVRDLVLGHLAIPRRVLADDLLIRERPLRVSEAVS